MEDQIQEQTENTDNTQSMETNTMPEEQAQATQNQSDSDAPEIDIEALQAQLEDLKREVTSNMEGWQRSRAEFTNYKRRTLQELADSKERGALDALTKILPIVDDFERAIENIPEELEEHPWVNGTSLILKNMHKVMDAYNISEIDPVGEEFDPNLHEAIGIDDSDEYENGTITTTLQKGYRSGDRILRPALVRVAS